MHIATAFQGECVATQKTSYTSIVEEEEEEEEKKAFGTSIALRRAKEISEREHFVGKFKMHELMHFQQIYSYISQLFIAK